MASDGLMNRERSRSRKNLIHFHRDFLGETFYDYLYFVRLP